MMAAKTLMLAKRKHAGYGEGMSPNLLVRNVPTEIHATLVRRAEAEGRSLQEYVMSLLSESAGKPTMAEVMAEIEANLAAHPVPSMSTEEIVATIREGREERTKRLFG
jgi:plasmid stability protein